VTQIGIERTRDFYDVIEAYVLLAALNLTDIRPMQSCSFGKLFL
jgi:hypothetical protein